MVSPVPGAVRPRIAPLRRHVESPGPVLRDGHGQPPRHTLGLSHAGVAGPGELAGAFARDGVVCVRDVLDPGELMEAARPSRWCWPARARSCRCQRRGRSGSFTRTSAVAEIPEIERLAKIPGAADRRHRDVVAEGAVLPRPRPGQGGRDQAAHAVHQDQPYYNVDGLGSAPGSRSIRYLRRAAWNWWPARTGARG